jgi:hypothetical protein
LNPITQAIQEFLADPKASEALSAAVARVFGPATEPGRLEAFDRFIAKAQHQFTARSFAIPFAAGSAAVQICERNPTRIRLLLFNLGPNTVFIGHQQVTAGAQANDPNAGYPMLTGTSLVLDVATELYAIAVTAICDLRVADLVH